MGWKVIRWYSSNMVSMTSKLAGFAPVRHVFIHVINATPAAVTLANMLLPFCGQKIRKKFKFHSNLNSLHEDLGTDVLPVELGGSKPLDYDKLREILYHSFNKHPKKFLRRMKCEPDLITRPILHDRLR